jgi:hypothetical protein
MRIRKIFAGAGLAVIVVAGGLAVPSSEGGDRDSAHGFPERVLRHLGAILANTQTILARIGDMGEAVEGLQFTAEGVRDACAPPDLLPVPLDFPGSGFCRVEGANLVVRVRNQGAAEAGPSTLRVTFDVGGTGVPVEAPTQGLGPNGTTDVEIPGGFPAGCFAPDACTFQIAVDATDVVRPEASQENNLAMGTCLIVE